MSMSARVEIPSRIIEWSQTDETKNSNVEDDESDNDSSGQELGSEGSDADIFLHSVVVDRGNAQIPVHIHSQQSNFYEEFGTSNESEIVFLKLKLKLLVKESNDEYRKLLTRFEASEDTVKALVKINRSVKDEHSEWEKGGNKLWSPQSRNGFGTPQSPALVSPQLSELTNSLANLKWGFRKRENELLSQLEQYKKMTSQLHISQKKLRMTLRTVCERMCDSLVGAEQAVEEDRDLVDRHRNEDSLQRCQIVELKKRNKALEARVTEVSKKMLEKELEMQEIDMGREKAQILEREAHKEQEREAGRGLMEILQQQGLLEEQNIALVDTLARNELKDSADVDALASLRVQINILEQYVAVQEDESIKDKETISTLTAEYRLLQERALLLDKDSNSSLYRANTLHQDQDQGNGYASGTIESWEKENEGVDEGGESVYEEEDDSEEDQSEEEFEQSRSDVHHHTVKGCVKLRRKCLQTRAVCLESAKGPSNSNCNPFGRSNTDDTGGIPSREIDSQTSGDSYSLPFFHDEGDLDEDYLPPSPSRDMQTDDCNSSRGIAKAKDKDNGQNVVAKDHDLNCKTQGFTPTDGGDGCRAADHLLDQPDRGSHTTGTMENDTGTMENDAACASQLHKYQQADDSHSISKDTSRLKEGEGEGEGEGECEGGLKQDRSRQLDMDNAIMCSSGEDIIAMGNIAPEIAPIPIRVIVANTQLGQEASKSPDSTEDCVTKNFMCPSPSFSVRPANVCTFNAHLHNSPSDKTANDDRRHHETAMKVEAGKISTRISSSGDRVERFRDLLNLHVERFEALSVDHPVKDTETSLSGDHRNGKIAVFIESTRPRIERQPLSALYSNHSDELDVEATYPSIGGPGVSQSRTAPLSVDVTNCRELRRNVNVREFRHPRSIPLKGVTVPPHSHLPSFTTGSSRSGVSVFPMYLSDRCDTLSYVDLTEERDISGKDVLTGAKSISEYRHMNYDAGPDPEQVRAPVKAKGNQRAVSASVSDQRSNEFDRPHQSKTRPHRATTTSTFTPLTLDHQSISLSGDVNCHGNARIRKVRREAFDSNTLSSSSEHSEQYKNCCLEVEYERYLYHFRREQDRVALGLRAQAQREYYQSVIVPAPAPAPAPSVRTVVPQSGLQEHFPATAPVSFQASSSLSSRPQKMTQPLHPFVFPNDMEDQQVLEVLRSAKAALDISHVDMRHTYTQQKIIDLALKVDTLQLENRHLKHYNETSQAQSTY